MAIQHLMWTTNSYNPDANGVIQSEIPNSQFSLQGLQSQILNSKFGKTDTACANRPPILSNLKSEICNLQLPISASPFLRPSHL